MSDAKTADFGDYAVTDQGNGISVITVPDDPAPAGETPARKGLIARLIDWWKGSKVKPVVKVVDIGDPAGELKNRDPDYKGKPGVVIGVQVDF